MASRVNLPKSTKRPGPMSRFMSNPTAASAGPARASPEGAQQRNQRVFSTSKIYTQQQPWQNEYDSARRDSSPPIKPEPSESLHRLSLADACRSQMYTPDAMRPSKRPAVEEDSRPYKLRSGSASPYSSARHEQDHSQIYPPPPGSSRPRSPSAGFRSAQQTPVSSPRAIVQQFNSLSRQNARPLNQNSSPERKIFDPDPPDQNQDIPYDPDSKMLLQPETRPISQEQLVNEVKGIYAGLVMVEKKCVEICQQQALTTNKLSNEQWQALIALHRTLLHEHHDFFLASQHPTASLALRRLPTKYAMPARMWRHGIHSFLELLRHRLPYSLEHMLSFVYLAYQMMGLLMESVPAFHETWIECLGDLARYRMAIEEADMRDRETWSNVARMWYNKAADRSPDTGRIQHHLAVLARPNITCQLFYYSKALISVNPFPNARDSIMLLFNPVLEGSALTGQPPRADSPLSKYSKFDSSLVVAAGILFTRGLIHDYDVHVTQFVSELDNQITRSGSNWKVQGAEVASSLIACMLDFGSDGNFLWDAFGAHQDKLKRSQAEQAAKKIATEKEPITKEPITKESITKDPITKESITKDPITKEPITKEPITKEDFHRKFWKEGPISAEGFRQAAPPAGDQPGLKFTSSDEVTSYVLPVWSTTISIVASKVGDRSILPFLHLTLAYIWSLSYVPGALVYLGNYVPWAKLVLSLNSLNKSGVVDARVESKEFPQQQSGTGRQLPEDFPMRGLVWAPYYFPGDFFEGQVVDEDERTLELPSHAAPRAERCLWLGCRLASLNRYMTYNVTTKQFSCTEFALSLPGNASIHTLHVHPPSTERDVPMVDV